MGTNSDLPFEKKCRCGAISVTILDTNGNEVTMSMPQEKYEQYFSMISIEKNLYSCCDNCVNKYGVIIYSEKTKPIVTRGYEIKKLNEAILEGEKDC